MIVGFRGQKLYELGILCPEYPGLRPEYSGKVLQMGPCIVINASNVQPTFLLYFHKLRLHLLPCFVSSPSSQPYTETRRRA